MIRGSQSVTKIDRKSIQNLSKIGAQLMMHLGVRHDSENPPKTFPKSNKNESKIDLKNDHFSHAFGVAFPVALGANMPENPPNIKPGNLGQLAGKPAGQLEYLWQIGAN